MNTQAKLIVLSAGGTGGHVVPAAALAKDLQARGFRVEWVTDSRGQKFAPMFHGVPCHVVQSGTLGGGVIGKVKGMAALGFGLLQARQLVARLKPAMVIGFGGYPSFPAVHAAQALNIPTIVHEQNAVLGKANVMLAKKAARVALSWSARGEQSQSLALAQKTVVTGNPVREDIAALYTKPYPNMMNASAVTFFIMGGSLGAKVFADVVPTALSRLSSDQRARLDVVQQCREEDLAMVREAYAKAGIKARLESFLNDVPEILARTHLVIARSGASTVAEVAAAGRPSIFVPYPHHADQQQKFNAESLAQCGGAWVMAQSGFTEDALLVRLETFFQNPEILTKAAEAARGCGKPDATLRLGNLVVETLAGWNAPSATSQDDSPIRSLAA